jgi:pimeloyl-ACP methyl ester carboxylesterase
LYPGIVPRRLLLFPGLAGDARLFKLLKIPGVELAAPDHLEPRHGEDLPDYAARLAHEHRVQAEDVIGGASFGGMLASEIASKIKVRGLVLLGTCHRPRLLPYSYRVAEKLQFAIPDAALGLRSWLGLIKWRFAPLTPEAETTLRAMSETFPVSYIRRFGRMIMRWKGVEDPPGPKLVVHGDRDRILPISCATPDVVFKGAGHIFTLTHPEETNAAVSTFLKGLP